MSTTTDIFLPDTLPYPIKVVSLIANISDNVEIGQRLLKYTYTVVSDDNSSLSETRYGSWESNFDGELHLWKVRVGDIITRQRAKDVPALLILESCKHGVQFNGLCALCGMNLEDFDFSGRSESSLATIQMTHSASGPTVSLEEAEKLERETAQRLLKSRKLSLIVDLDQTIVHATVDPTVGEWISEGEAWERRREEKREQQQRRQDEEMIGIDDDVAEEEEEDEEKDEANLNWSALKDVKRFRLAPEVFGGGQALNRAHKSQEKHKSLETEGCIYYIKPRPGWKAFLESAAKKYEMHVYTMGTRAYAEEVCGTIDPDGRLFGGRILSRDESGSLSQKSLRRLFPCDTSMVVIIDDRADVWEWSPNLIKVIPYDFFVGIGDINSTFLPKLNTPSSILGRPEIASQQPKAVKPSESTLPTLASTTDVIDASTAASVDEDPQELAKSELISLNNEALEAQLDERPLAKKQEELLEHAQNLNDITANLPNTSIEEGSAVDNVHPPERKFARKALLNNNDAELSRVGQLLDDVHNSFFEAYDSKCRDNTKSNGKTGKRSDKSRTQVVKHDVTSIIPRIRMETFKGVHILFSGVIPTNIMMDHEKTDIWKTACAFGAVCHKDLTDEVTHVVTSKRGTQKVDRALKQGSVYIVWLSWFNDSIAKWQRQDETLYLLDDSTIPFSPALTTNISSSISTSTSWNRSNNYQETAPSPKTSMGTEMSLENDLEPLSFGDVDWQDVHDEVEAAMLESDSEEEDNVDDSERINVDSNNVSETEGFLDNERRIDFNSHKRMRSVTPSTFGSSFDIHQVEDSSTPLSKRKKTTAMGSFDSDMRFSNISGVINDEENDMYTKKSNDFSRETNQEEIDDEEQDDEESEEEDEDFDFLANELELG